MANIQCRDSNKRGRVAVRSGARLPVLDYARPQSTRGDCRQAGAAYSRRGPRRPGGGTPAGVCHTRWTVVRGSDLEEGESPGIPVWTRHLGDPILMSNMARRVDFALFMVAALENLFA